MLMRLVPEKGFGHVSSRGSMLIRAQAMLCIPNGIEYFLKVRILSNQVIHKMIAHPLCLGDMTGYQRGLACYACHRRMHDSFAAITIFGTAKHASASGVLKPQDVRHGGHGNIEGEIDV